MADAYVDKLFFFIIDLRFSHAWTQTLPGGASYFSRIRCCAAQPRAPDLEAESSEGSI